jgi:hypothetical protein
MRDVRMKGLETTKLLHLGRYFRVDRNDSGKRHKPFGRYAMLLDIQNE